MVADVNLDGNINCRDIRFILNHIAGFLGFETLSIYDVGV